jgi:hypothetical protein
MLEGKALAAEEFCGRNGRVGSFGCQIRAGLPDERNQIMAKPNYQFEKRAREMAQKKKKEEKRLRKLAERSAKAPAAETPPPAG